mgnify:CR=1 FL=1
MKFVEVVDSFDKLGDRLARHVLVEHGLALDVAHGALHPQVPVVEDDELERDQLQVGVLAHLLGHGLDVVVLNGRHDADGRADAEADGRHEQRVGDGRRDAVAVARGALADRKSVV